MQIHEYERAPEILILRTFWFNLGLSEYNFTVF